LIQQYQYQVSSLESWINTVRKGVEGRADKRFTQDQAHFMGNRDIAKRNAPNTRTRNATGTFGSQQFIDPKVAAPLRGDDADDSDIVFNRPSGGPQPRR